MLSIPEPVPDPQTLLALGQPDLSSGVPLEARRTEVGRRRRRAPNFGLFESIFSAIREAATSL
jgi:hypothetical protein